MEVVQHISIRLRGGFADHLQIVGDHEWVSAFRGAPTGLSSRSTEMCLDLLLQYPISLSVSARRGMFKSRPVRFRERGIDRGADPGFGGPSLSEPWHAWGICQHILLNVQTPEVPISYSAPRTAGCPVYTNNRIAVRSRPQPLSSRCPTNPEIMCGLRYQCLQIGTYEMSITIRYVPYIFLQHNSTTNLNLFPHIPLQPHSRI